ncbi:hypothetical protein J437_LFUL003615 [Ladona fulva]|uniref:Uncharacterized protein n=1 Tax=Ladona fulva TaxID=123851 RepID=A0A8K0KIU9_LADFU|nr:hypothetical protein J437_LFUL003615 [Ladona fulva]
MRSLMTVYCWVKMFWSDEKLKWNSSDYGGLTRLYLPDHEIWQPDIVLYNRDYCWKVIKKGSLSRSASGTEVDHYGSTHSIVHEDGTVLWVPPSLFRVFCDLNLRLWPYDEQTCILRLGSWTYDGDQVDLQLDEHEAEMDLMVPNTEWEITSLTRKRNVAYYSCCTEAYIDVTFTLTLKRRSPTYNAVVITPASVIVVMTLMTFWLPPNSGEKLMLGGCTALIICIFMLFFAQMLPAMANHTPLVVTFYSSSLILVTISMIVSVAVLNLSRPYHVMSVPWPIKSTLTGFVGRVLGLGNYISLATAQQHGILGSNTGEELREHHLDDPSIEERHMIPVSSQSSGTSSHRSNHYDWILLAAAVDRVAFLVYCLLFGILAAVYV